MALSTEKSLQSTGKPQRRRINSSLIGEYVAKFPNGAQNFVSAKGPPTVSLQPPMAFPGPARRQTYVCGSREAQKGIPRFLRNLLQAPDSGVAAPGAAAWPWRSRRDNSTCQTNARLQGAPDDDVAAINAYSENWQLARRPGNQTKIEDCLQIMTNHTSSLVNHYIISNMMVLS